MPFGERQPPIDIPPRRLTDRERPGCDRDRILGVTVDASFGIFDTGVDTDAGADAGRGPDERAAGRGSNARGDPLIAELMAEPLLEQAARPSITITSRKKSLAGLRFFIPGQLSAVSPGSPQG
jgi:hypothetical protein